MKICITYNPEYVKLRNFFIKQFRDEKRIDILENIIVTNGRIGFGTESWYDSVLSKIKFIVDTMKNSNDKIICLSDIDIYYGNINRLIEDAEIFADSHFQLSACYEVYKEFLTEDHMRRYNEHVSINSGFIMIKNNRDNINLFESVLKMNLKKFRYGDQDAINHLIFTRRIPCFRLPPEKYICNCYIKYISQSDIRNCVLYHANCIENEKQKINKLRMFKNKYWGVNRQSY